MLLPEGVNPISFFEQAKAKKIKISSRYVGVVFNINTNGAPSWMVRYQKKGKAAFIGRFPFTVQGEWEAGIAYSRAKETHETKTNPTP
jgi:hypothetical protein